MPCTLFSPLVGIPERFFERVRGLELYFQEVHSVGGRECSRRERAGGGHSGEADWRLLRYFR